MWSIILYFFLSILINLLVIGEPFWQMITSSSAWIMIAVPLVILWIGIECIGEDSRPVKILGSGIVIFLVVGFLAFWFVGRIRAGICGCLGIEGPEEIFRYFDNLSVWQIIVIGVLETVIGGILLANHEMKSDDSEKKL